MVYICFAGKSLCVEDPRPMFDKIFRFLASN